MNSSQASARHGGPRLVAVHAPGAAAADLIDRTWAAGDAVTPLDATASVAVARATATALGAHRIVGRSGRIDLDAGVGLPAGTALVVRTSGTTGLARGVVLGHTALEAAVATSVDRLDATDARWLGVLPLHHIAGLLVLLRSRATRTPVTLHDRFDVAAVAAETHATHVALVPTMLHRLLDHGVDVGRFDRILLGGAAPPAGLLERALAAGAHVTVSYGMTETAGGCVYDGRPLDGVAVAVDPDGRVLVRGDVLADGYRTDHGVAPLPDRAGWFRTNDVGRFDSDRLVITGRADDVVVSGGVNVPTAAVADVLRRHPGVADAAVVGIDDVEWGQRIVAFVVAADPAAPPSPELLRGHVRSSAPAAWVPREVRYVAALPRTALGKIDGAALRAEAVRAG